MLNELPLPAIFAHRGASAYAPENTLAAFSLAVRQGADAAELDAKLSADGYVVVIHDQTVDRTTNGSGRVRDLPLQALRDLNAGSFFDWEFAGEKIPTLEEVFEQVGAQIFLNVELTNYASLLDDLPEKVSALVKKHGLQKRVMFSSFNPIALLRARRMMPEIPLGLLAFPGLAGSPARSWLGRLVRYQALNPHIRDVTTGLVEAAHHRGQRVYVYTVNQAEQMQALFRAGVDGIFTDDPLLALSLREKAG